MDTTIITLDGGKIITSHHHGHEIKTDQPLAGGGTNSAPAPFDLFLASIGTCAGIYVKSFCDQRGIPTDKIHIIQTVDFDMQKRLPSKIKLDIHLPVDFPEKYRNAVISAADLCAVKRAILDPPLFEVVTSLVDQDQAK
jgi:ribosomal protein S12 methylthiotransferase accessory factor